MPPNAPHVAIIGFGPKGLYAFERLCAEVKARGLSRQVHVHLFNDNSYWGAGQNFRFDQADYQLINFNIGYVNMWSETGPPPVVPDPTSLTEWLRQTHSTARVHERSFVGRAAVGAYLHDGWRRIMDHRPDNIRVRLHETRVEDLRPRGRQWEITTRDRQTLSARFDEVLLTTGHQRHRPDAYHRACREHCATHPGTAFVPFVYPTHERLRELAPGTAVAVKGLGLTYVDAVLELTEGRGGRFEGSLLNGFKYHASGAEPERIYPFSRSGLPMFPRGNTYGIPGLPLRFFTTDNLRELVAGKGRLDWRNDLLPLLRAEMYAAYYHHLFAQYGRELPEDVGVGLLYRLIADFHRDFPLEQVFHPKQLLYPERRNVLSAHVSHFRHFQELCLAAAAGETSHPLAAAAAVWRYANPVFATTYAFGGLTPQAQRNFLDHWAGNLNRLTYGMPLVNALKLVALAEAGILDFSYVQSPRVEFCGEGGFALRSPGRPPCVVQSLVDARIPKTALEKDANPLYRRLLERKIIRPYANRSARGQKYLPGCLDLDPQGAVIDGQGVPHPYLHVTGIPTEGVTFDNDTLSTTKNNFGRMWAERLVERLAAAAPSPKSTMTI